MTTQNETPWGSNGIRIQNRNSVHEAMVEAKMDWDVNLEDVFLQDGTTVPKAKVTRRSDNGEILGVVGDRYTVLQNSEAFEWFQPWIDANMARIETVGSFKGGKVLFLQAAINTDLIEIVKGDAIKSYITLAHAHDGSLCVYAGFNPVRLFCTNQLPMLKKASSSKLLKMKHTKNLSFAMDKIQQIMDISKQEFLATAEQYRFLAAKGVDKKTLELYVNQIYRKEDDAIDKEVRKATFEKIETLFEDGRGMSGGTRNMWGAFNSITEYLTWEAGRSADARLHSLWFGNAQQTAQKALDVALEMSR